AHSKTSREVMFRYKLLGVYQQFNPNNPIELQKIEVQKMQVTPQTIDNHLKKISVIHNEVNNQLEKSRKYMLKHSSVHCHKNLYKPGQSVAIASDTDMNPTTRKYKLQTTFKETGTVVSMMNNNKTIVVETSEGNTVRCSVKRVQQIKKK
ncbi:35849_t:CDS:1, partial [Racocetra persica]